jgi:hypothetical protein
MASARAIFQAHVDDLDAESLGTTLQWALTSGVYERRFVTLASGDNTLTVPTGAKILVVLPPTTNGSAIKVHSSSAASAWTLLPSQPSVLTLGAAPYIVNAGASISGVQLIFLG